MSTITDEKTYTPEEIAANRKVWTDALRSGEYKQCAGKLTSGGGYCCLGVGSEVLEFPLFTDGISRMLPVPEFMEALDLAGDAGVTSIIDECGQLVALSSLNDEHAFSFAEIADLIDEGVLLPRDPANTYWDAVCDPLTNGE